MQQQKKSFERKILFFEAEWKVNTADGICNRTNAHNQLKFIVSFHEASTLLYCCCCFFCWTNEC